MATIEGFLKKLTLEKIKKRKPKNFFERSKLIVNNSVIDKHINICSLYEPFR